MLMSSRAYWPIKSLLTDGHILHNDPRLYNTPVRALKLSTGKTPPTKYKHLNCNNLSTPETPQSFFSYVFAPQLSFTFKTLIGLAFLPFEIACDESHFRFNMYWKEYHVELRKRQKTSDNFIPYDNDKFWKPSSSSLGKTLEVNSQAKI